jgi:hypothetical protein
VIAGAIAPGFRVGRSYPCMVVERSAVEMALTNWFRTLTQGVQSLATDVSLLMPRKGFFGELERRPGGGFLNVAWGDDNVLMAVNASRVRS